jgi:hypothetical protein
MMASATFASGFIDLQAQYRSKKSDVLTQNRIGFAGKGAFVLLYATRIYNYHIPIRGADCKVIQKKTGRPVSFELPPATRDALQGWIADETSTCSNRIERLCRRG